MAGPPDPASASLHYNSVMDERRTLCISSKNPGFSLHRGDDGFREGVEANYDPHESLANERMALLKARLPLVPSDEFWTVMMEGITEILGAQYAICSKRIAPGEERIVMEMPGAGAPGSCLTMLAFLCNDGSIDRMTNDFDYETYGGPCAHMRHDKTFLIPTGLSEFITSPLGDKYFPNPMESYIGVPLFAEGKCFGHFGAFWSVPGSKERKLGWGFIEMALKALEDVVAAHVLGGIQFGRAKEPAAPKSSILSNNIVAAMQSLKPYARSLSHELRTPMHGVVGMLDIMYATVQEALESPSEQDVVSLLRGLRENIETIQDSSKRAVEAADNVVHAYDLNMEVPDIPAPPQDEDLESIHGCVSPGTYAADATPITGLKRKNLFVDDSDRSPKHRMMEAETTRSSTPHTQALRSVIHESNQITSLMRPGNVARSERETSPMSPSTPGMRITRIREVVRLVVNEALRFGGRPDSAIASETDLGEMIEVRNRTSSGEASTKMVEWAVDPSVPEEILVDERDFAKLVSVLFLNALKFTTDGNVKLYASLSSKSRYVVITVSDTGAGIPAAFRPFLFKAFSREDDSLTRQNEGLGLGLMVAKAVARRIGGDVICLRSDTEGPNRGSEFELRVPLTPPADNFSRNSSPSRAPTPLQLDAGPHTPALSDTNGPNTANSSPTISARRLDIPRDHPARDSITSVPANLYTYSPAARRDSHNTSSTNTTEAARRPSSSRPSLATTTNGSVAVTTTITTTPPTPTFDRNLASKHPLNVLVAEDNRINRKLLVNMLKRLGYTSVQEAFDGTEAVRLMELDARKPPGAQGKVDVVLMDLWMPNMDGYEAAQRILAMQKERAPVKLVAPTKLDPVVPLQQRDETGGGGRNGLKKDKVKILAVSADITDEALDRAKEVGMSGFMTKPYRMLDLERLLVEYCGSATAAAA